MSTGSLVLPNQQTVSSLSKSALMRACIIWGLAALFYFYDNLLQVSPSAMKPELSLAFAKEAEQFGSLSAYCLYAYGLMQIPAGLLMDRFGPRRLLTFASLFCGIGSIVFGLATSLWEAKFGRAMIGVGASFAVVGCLKIASYWFPTNRFALMTGLTITVGFLGAVFGLSTVSKIVEVFGWRASMQWGGLLGILLSTLLWLVLKDKIYHDHADTTVKKAALSSKSDTQSISSCDTTPARVNSGAYKLVCEQQTEPATNERRRVNAGVLKGFWQVLRHSQTWIAALYAGFMFVPTLAFGGLWGIPFLVESHGFDRPTAGLCISLIYVGWVVGGPVWGFVSDYLGRRNLPMMIATLSALVICVAVIYLEGLSVELLGSLLFGLGFFSSGFILAFAVVREIHSSDVSGTAIGFTNALNTLWGSIAQPIIGKILDLSSSSQPIVEGNVEKVFNLVEYQRALMALPISLIISLCLLCFLKETFCRSKH